MYAEMMDELKTESEYVARQIVNVAIRSWMAQVTVKICPDKLPAQWRDRPQLYRTAAVAVRNVRLGILLKLGRTLRTANDATHAKRAENLQEAMSPSVARQSMRDPVGAHHTRTAASIACLNGRCRSR